MMIIRLSLIFDTALTKNVRLHYAADRR